MNAEGADVLTWLDDQLTEAREAAAKAVGRATALVELRSMVFALAAREGVHELTVSELLAAADGESELARLTALCQRATEPNQEMNHAA